MVVQVIDGDTLSVQPQGRSSKPVRVRILGVDAPESCQTGGPTATSALSRRVKQQLVDVQSVGKDAYGRSLARVRLDGDDIGAWLVREGFAWNYQYRKDKGPYATQEHQAQAERRGIHATSAAMRPAEFRASRGLCNGAAANEYENVPLPRSAAGSLGGDSLGTSLSPRASSDHLFSELVGSSSTSSSTRRARSPLGSELDGTAGAGLTSTTPTTSAAARVRERQARLESERAQINAPINPSRKARTVQPTPVEPDDLGALDDLPAPVTRRSSRTPRQEVDPLERFAR